MSLKGKKIGILIESDFYEKEIFYYEHRFAEEGIEVHWLSRLWGQPSLTFTGHEYKVPFDCSESFEGMSDEELRTYDAIIVPSAFVSDRLRYSETSGQARAGRGVHPARVCRAGHPQGHHLPRHCGWSRRYPSWCAGGRWCAIPTCTAMPRTWARSTPTRMWWWTATW